MMIMIFIVINIIIINNDNIHNNNKPKLLTNNLSIVLYNFVLICYWLRSLGRHRNMGFT